MSRSMNIYKNKCCGICNGKDFHIIADNNTIRFKCYGYDKKVLKCSNCGQVQLIPPWTENDLNELYSKYSEKKDFGGQNRIENERLYLDKLINEKDKILEIGCGLGDNLRRLKKLGYNIVGIDKDPEVCDNILIFNKDYKDLDQTKEKYDFIYSIHVMEHILNPKVFIRKIIDSLSRKGQFIIEVPNVDDPLLKIYKIKEFNQYYWYPYHLYFYNKQTLKKLFSEFDDINFTINLSQRYGLNNHLRWLIKKSPGNNNEKIPLLDIFYTFWLTKILKVSDTLIVHCEKI